VIPPATKHGWCEDAAEPGLPFLSTAYTKRSICDSTGYADDKNEQKNLKLSV
jgi:hypothetical protein